MHKFLRAIGFSELTSRKELQKIITDSIQEATVRTYTTNEEGEIMAEFRRDFANGIGIVVRGEFDDEDRFIYEYYYPYLIGTGISSTEDITVERLAAQDAYVGACDEVRVGVSLVFYLQNMMEYLRERQLGGRSIKYSSVTLSGLCNEGTILLPVLKSKEQEREQQEDVHNRMLLLSAAKSGDPQAIESLTLDDIDTYSKVSRRLISEDVFTIVDTYIMPYGIECDRYSIMGEILEYRLTRNEITREDICIMKLDVNGLLFDVCVPKREVMGEPAVGRRFKGNVWLQGRINF